MKVEYELQVSGVGNPIEYVREGISYPLMLYAGGYCLAVMAISAALSHGYPVNSMAFFNSAVGVLQTLVVALGAGLGVWGVINLMEGYGNDNPGAKSQGMKHVIPSLLEQ